MSPRVLIVEDDDLIGPSLQRALEASGYIAERVGDGATALPRVRDGAVDLVLLDLGLPDTDGIDLARAMLTSRPGLPIVMLTARAEEADVVTGLHAGAVDYVTKPFRLAELLARVHAHLRAAREHDEQGRVIGVGDLRVDVAARRAWTAGGEVELRAREFDLLARLVRSAGEVVTREQLMSDVWDEHWNGSTKTLDVHVASLRRRLGEEPGMPSRITALRGVGYRLETPMIRI
ncbi:response regulator transcription factor [Pseudonocardia abyssalis]|uniref:response regulator transcription factor n=1 Tax=Pseudonocardia abyssalis TaxID=2792008 RepID=UPI001C4A22F1|nr:response regulator transcription factor [Pseudonocardia abyssalis]